MYSSDFPPLFRMCDPWSRGFLIVPPLKVPKRKTDYIGSEPWLLRPSDLCRYPCLTFWDKRNWLPAPFSVGSFGLLKIWYWRHEIGLWCLSFPECSWTRTVTTHPSDLRDKEVVEGPHFSARGGRTQSQPHIMTLWGREMSVPI